MKTQIKPIIWFLTLLALFSAPRLASGYYDPGVQRWVNRDPLDAAPKSSLWANLPAESRREGLLNVSVNDDVNNN
jgi:hypothetical protein